MQAAGLTASLLICLSAIAHAGESKTKEPQGGTRLSDSRKRGPDFADYPALQVFGGKVVPPRFRKSSAPGYDFPDGDPHCGWDQGGFNDKFYGAMKVNFAGHYVITGCTCGTACHYLLMWDARTGEVIRNLPVGTIDVGQSIHGTEPIGERHRADSNLLVIEGCFDQDAHPERRDCGRRYYLWTKSKKFVRAAPAGQFVH